MNNGNILLTNIKMTVSSAIIETVTSNCYLFKMYCKGAFSTKTYWGIFTSELLL